jgi:ribosomal protein S18 acetylase RimI-like enzyme
MFSLNRQLADKCAGVQHFFRCEDVQGLYKQHKSVGAPIVADLENKPWGLCEYTVRDPDGYELRFTGPEQYERPKTATDSLPSHIAIEKRTPTLADACALHKSVGWAEDRERLGPALERSILCITARDLRDQDRRSVGMVRVVGDGKSFTIYDVIVHKDYQGQRIGSAMIEAALTELRKIAKKGSFVGLFTMKPAFYERLGFVNGGGMHLPL